MGFLYNCLSSSPYKYSFNGIFNDFSDIICFQNIII